MIRSLFLPFICLFLIFMGSLSVIYGQTGLWREFDDSSYTGRRISRLRVPDEHAAFRLNKQMLSKLLKSAPEEFTNGFPDRVIELPMPDGKTKRFRIEHSLVVEPGLAAKYPELGSTFRGYGIDDPTSTVRFDMLRNGFHAMVLSSGGTVLVDPYSDGEDDEYVSYYKRDLPERPEFTCGVSDRTLSSFLSSYSAEQSSFLPDASPNIASGTQLRTYRLALAGDSEYCTAVGGNTVAGCLAAQVLIMNRVNGVYERDLAIHMNIVANNNLIVYAADNMNCSGSCNSSNDPYSNSNESLLLTQNQSNLDSVIGPGNYDIGHVFTTGGGGLAAIGVSCGGSKAMGETGLGNPVGDAFAIDYVSHEMGHQWGANHTFNGAVSNCSGGNRFASAAYEPGSGITIMGYAGICGSQNLARHSIDSFHVKSLQEIIAFSQSGGGNVCAVESATGNTPPSVSVVGGPSFNIPKQTPFALTASASDVDLDNITYDWQEFDLGASTTSIPNTDAGGAMPIFRPYSPSTSPTRFFPSIAYILNNANVPPPTSGSCPNGSCLTGEMLPQISRTMTFEVIVRDNHSQGGGINTATATVIVDGSSGPFSVTSPNSAVTYAGGSTAAVTWNVANTSNAPVSSPNVKVSFSSDGGNTFPIVLSASTPNSGSANVTIPNISTTQARIKVESTNSIFFDISDTNFTVNATTAATHAVSDFDGDGRSDISVWRPADGNWYFIKSSDSTVNAFHFGSNGDQIVPGDYDGDGKTDFAVFRSGTWFISGSTAGFSGAQFGLATDLPAQGDFDGDGKADIAVYRPSDGTWYIQASTAGFSATQFGANGDKPVAGDYDGDGRSDIAVYRPTDGNWYQLRSTAGFAGVHFGISTDKVVPADYDGDGKVDPAVFRSDTGTWFLLRSSLGFSGVQFGSLNDIPAPGDFDGDGTADIDLYRPSQGTWFRLNSSNSAFSATQFGNSVDMPTPAGYLPVQ
jgi:hypothetical protein